MTSTRRLVRPAIGVVAVVTLTLVGCSGSLRSLTGSPPGGASQSAGAAVSEPGGSRPSSGPAATTGGALRGIVVEQVSATGIRVVTAMDPLTGKVTAKRTFAPPQGVDAGSRSQSNLATRSLYNADYSLVASTGPTQPDGSTSAGVVGTDGRFVPKTTTTSGYASPERKAAIGFDPAGRLWYVIASGSLGGGVAGSQFGSVDPTTGSSSERKETVDAATLHSPNGNFSGDVYWMGSYGPIDVASVEQSDDLLLPGGVEVKEADLPSSVSDTCPGSDSGRGWQVGPSGSISDQTPVLPAPNQCLPWPTYPVWPVSAKGFLAVYASGGFGLRQNATQLYYDEVVPGRIQTTALLPESDRLVGDVISNTGGSTAAFISKAGTTLSLYTVPLTGAQQPRKIADLDPESSDTHLLGWTG